MKGVVYIATSLDGFIARSGGEVDWLESDGAAGENYGFARFIRSVDALVMGRNTYDVVRSFGLWPYGELPVVVWTRQELEIPLELRPSVESNSNLPGDLWADLATRGIDRVYVDGGRTIQAFLAAGLIEEITITRIPIILGTGVPLFGAINTGVRLRHLATHAYDDGIVQSRYALE